MKKVMILTAAVMAFSFATPQVAKAIKVQNQMAIVQDKDDKYKEIKVEELPEAVTKSVATAYTGYKIDKAYKTEDNAYKVKVTMGDLNYQLFYDAKGDLIKVEDPSATKGMDPSMKGMDHSNKSMEPANKSMEPSKKSKTTTPPTEKYPVK